SAAVDRRREPLIPDVEAIRLELAAEPGCGSPGTGAAGSPIRVLGGEVRGERRCRGAVERWRQVGRLERGRPSAAEREQEERQADEEPRAAVEARVDRTLERPGPRPSALGCGRGGRHGYPV